MIATNQYATIDSTSRELLECLDALFLFITGIVLNSDVGPIIINLGGRAV